MHFILYGLFLRSVLSLTEQLPCASKCALCSIDATRAVGVDFVNSAGIADQSLLVLIHNFLSLYRYRTTWLWLNSSPGPNGRCYYAVLQAKVSSELGHVLVGLPTFVFASMLLMTTLFISDTSYEHCTTVPDLEFVSEACETIHIVLMSISVWLLWLIDLSSNRYQFEKERTPAKGDESR